MTEEVKADLSDAKDTMKQAGYEMKIEGRKAKLNALEGIVDATGHKLTPSEKWEGAKMVGRDTVHNAGDKMQQARLAVKKTARDAKVDIDKTDTKKAIDDAADKTSDTLVDTKDAIKDTVAPPQTGFEKNQQIRRDQQKFEDRTERDAEKIQERKRQELVDDVKAKAAEVKQSLVHAKDKTEVALGEAALKLKDKVDSYTDDAPREKVTGRITDSGMDISSVENPRNPDLLAQDERDAKLEKARQEKTLGEKAKDTLTNAVESVKETFHEATTDPKPPIFIEKRSTKGVDISHVENAENVTLQEKEKRKLEEDKFQATQREKAVLEKELQKDAAEGKEQVIQETHTLKEKFEALGESVANAAIKLGDKLAAALHLTDPPGAPTDGPIEKESTTFSTDTTTFDKSHENQFGEPIETKEDGRILNQITTSDGTAPPTIKRKESLKDSLIRHTLDAGVAAKETVQGWKEEIGPMTLKERAGVMKEEMKEDLKVSAREMKRSAKEWKAKGKKKLEQGKKKLEKIMPKMALVPKQTEVVKESTATQTTLPVSQPQQPLDSSSTTTSSIGPSPKPELERKKAVPALPTPTPSTPENIDMIQTKSTVQKIST